MRRKFTAQTKAKIALKALEESETLSELASTSGAHATQIGVWKKNAKENLYQIFEKSNRESQKIKALETQVDELHRLIGTRDEELAWLQKKITP